MPWYVPFFAWLVQSAVSSLLVLLAATTAVALTRQPARRIRIIELTLVGVLVVPLLGALPGYPRWSLLPALGDEGPGQRRGEVARSLAETPLEPRAEPATTGPVVEPLAAAPPEMPVASELPMSPGDNAIGPADIEVPMAVEPAAPPSFATDYRFWIVAGYLAIAGALALWSLMGLAALWRLLRSARPAEPACRELLRQIAGPSGDRVALVVSPRAIQPCAVAWRPTTIVLGEARVRARGSAAVAVGLVARVVARRPRRRLGLVALDAGPLRVLLSTAGLAVAPKIARGSRFRGRCRGCRRVDRGLRRVSGHPRRRSFELPAGRRPGHWRPPLRPAKENRDARRPHHSPGTRQPTPLEPGCAAARHLVCCPRRRAGSAAPRQPTRPRRRTQQRTRPARPKRSRPLASPGPASSRLATTCRSK